MVPTAATIAPNPFGDTPVYKIGAPIMITICFVAAILNSRCLVAMRWARGTITPTLRLSLSLAAADLYTSVLTLLSFVFNSYLRNVWNRPSTPVETCCLLAMEAFRLGGILTIVSHLMALAVNHLLGIVWPLRYPAVRTLHVRITLLLIWLLPPTAFLLQFGPLAPDNQGLLALKHSCAYPPMFTFKWRLTFCSIVLIIPLGLMSIIYGYILKVVHSQTEVWIEARSSGSRRYKGPTTAALMTSPTTHQHNSNQTRTQRREINTNMGALYTTLHIVGSFVLFYLPAVVVWLTVCKGCVYEKFTTVEALWGNWFIQLLLISKPVVNPVIYAARMREVKEATRRMHAALGWGCCDGLGRDDSQRMRMESRQMRRNSGGSRTVMCRLTNNSSGQQGTLTVVCNEVTVL